MKLHFEIKGLREETRGADAGDQAQRCYPC